MAPLIEVNSLTKKFGDFTAVNQIDFQINRGEILGFLGPNGAGKTTTIKMINGLLRITSGRVIIKDMDVTKNRKAVKSICGYMSQKFSLYPLLTSLENLTFFAGISGLSKTEINRKKSELSQLVASEYLNLKVADIPPGIKQQVALFISMVHDPEILFLDEPTSGVDPENRRNFWEKIYELKNQGKTILVTTHNLDEAEYADRVIIINRGVKITDGEPGNLKTEHKVDSIEALFKQVVS